MISLLLTSCKPVLSMENIADNIRYLEHTRLRGQTNEYFIEVVIGRRQLEDFIKITALPKKMKLDNKIGYFYGEHKGELIEKDGKLSDEIKATIMQDFIVLKKNGNSEVVSLQPIVDIVNTQKVLEKAIYHIENLDENKDDITKRDVEIKILADMHGNAYIFVTFEGQGKFYSLLFDSETYDIIAEYNL